MKCEEAMGLLSARVDGELRGRRGRRLARHLDRCPDCGRVLSSLLRALGGLRSLGREGPAPSGTRVETVVARIRKERMGA